MSDTYRCPNCGGIMKQVGADLQKVYYQCEYCPTKKSVSLNSEDNVQYLIVKNELLTRVRMGVFDVNATQWQALQKEILKFMGSYEAAAHDIQLQISVVACITRGFSLLDAEKYKQCKNLYKATEKIYKKYMKDLKSQSDEEKRKSVEQYEEYRSKYKKCRNQYRNTKLAWKAVFFVARKFVLR